MEERGKGGIEMSVVEEEGGVVPGEEEEELSDHGSEGGSSTMTPNTLNNDSEHAQQ